MTNFFWRIILIDGEYVGSVARIPKKGSVTANFHTGGSAKKVGLVKRDKKIYSGELKEKMLGIIKKNIGLVSANGHRGELLTPHVELNEDLR